jgi:serine/threonine-protein kinase
MADVFEAQDRTEERRVALKLLRESMAREPRARERFVREGCAQELIKHRNVAVMYDVGVHAARPYLVLELLRGRSLADVVRAEGRVGVVRAASYGWQALQGLDATHAQGVLHRDLKPANLMLEPSDGPVERVVLIDFGFASLEGTVAITQRGHVVGSLPYLAPERLRGEHADERADLYGVGVILYELLVGRRPFLGKDDPTLMAQHVKELPRPLREAAPDAGIPAALEALVLRALAKRPADRPGSAKAMAEELDGVVAAAG